MTKPYSRFTKLLPPLALLMALACGSGGGNDAQDNSQVKFRFKAESGDQLVAYTLESNTLFGARTPHATSVLDPDTGISQLDLSKGLSYRLRLSRQGIEFMDTIVLKDQFLIAQNGVLDIGELNGLTSLMTWGAIRGAAALDGVTVETAIKQQLSTIAQVSNIQLLSDIKASHINENHFGKNYVAQMNLTVIFTARSSFAIRANTLTQAEWDDKATVLSNIYRAVVNKQTLAENTHLRDQYLDLFNTGSGALPLVSAANVQNQMVSSASVSSETLLNWSQSNVLSDIDLLMVQLGL